MDPKPATIASVLSQLATDAAPADRIAAVAAERMHAIHLALAPIIGERGVSALYRRSLLLAARDTSWAGFPQASAEAGDDYSALQSAIAQQTDALRSASPRRSSTPLHRAGGLIGMRDPTLLPPC